MTQPGLIVLMIDGVSADHIATELPRLPHLAALAQRGFQVHSLGVEVCGTSLPGRTSILTGAPAEVSGIYGNNIWDGRQFRYAHPDDVRIPTLPQLAGQAGLDTAVLGFGMVRPEDAAAFARPWWIGSMLQRARDAQPVPATEGWLRVLEQPQSERLTQLWQTQGLATPDTLLPAQTDPNARFLLAERWVFDTVAAVAQSNQRPQLIMAEFLMTDAVQHRLGYKSPLAHWAVRYADDLLGGLLQKLRESHLEEAYNIVVLSDHGHDRIDLAIHPEVVLPQFTWQCEGSMLHLAYTSQQQMEEASRRLAEYGVIAWDNQHIPAEFRKQVAAFLAPDGYAFEYDPASLATEAVGPAAAISSHGLRPGHPGDHRFLIAAGPDIARRKLEYAPANSVAPTLGRLLGLSHPGWAASNLFE